MAVAAAIELSGIHKSFGSVHAVRGVSLAIRKGAITGIVGENGAGKSTLMSILYGLYRADAGEIHIDGVPIRKIRIDDLRHQLGVVPQDTFLFSGTIADNISYAKPGATLEEIIRAAKIANGWW